MCWNYSQDFRPMSKDHSNHYQFAARGTTAQCLLFIFAALIIIIITILSIRCSKSDNCLLFISSAQNWEPPLHLLQVFFITLMDIIISYMIIMTINHHFSCSVILSICGFTMASFSYWRPIFLQVLQTQFQLKIKRFGKSHQKHKIHQNTISATFQP